MADVQERLEEITRRIVAGFDPERIVLFGSLARGDAGPDSDADLLVVMEVADSRRKTATAIDVALLGVDLPVDVIVVTPADVERYRNVIGTIIRPALREGKVLYERAA